MSVKFFRNPHAQRAVSVLTGIAFAGSLLLSACGGGATSSDMPQQSSAVSSVTKLPASGKAPMFKTSQLSSAKTSNRIAVTATSATGRRRCRIASRDTERQRHPRPVHDICLRRR
jgi:hypothetical protein